MLSISPWESVWGGQSISPGPNNPDYNMVTVHVKLRKVWNRWFQPNGHHFVLRTIWQFPLWFAPSPISKIKTWKDIFTYIKCAEIKRKCNKLSDSNDRVPTWLGSLFWLTTVKPVWNNHLYKNLFPVIYSIMCFTEDWRYQFTLASNVCFLELI